MKYMIANLLLAWLPPTRWFGIKRVILKVLGVDVGPGAKVCGNVRFYGGGQVTIGASAWIGIGARFYTSPGANVSIGDCCDIAPEVSFVCGSHEIGPASRRAGPGFSRSIDIGPGCWIGARVVALGGCRLGASSIVGAGSLLRGADYVGNTLWAGSPASAKRDLGDGV